MRFNVKRVSWLIVLIGLALIARAVFELLYESYDEIYSFTQFLSLFIRAIVFGIVILIWLGIVVRSESENNKLPWLIVLALEPFIGLALFLTFGRNFRRSGRYRDLPLLENGKYLTREPITNFKEKDYLSIDSEITDIYKTGFNSTKHHAYLNDTEVTVLTNGVEKFPRLINELQKANSFILMQYYILRTDKIGKQILSILKEKAEKGVDVYLLYDAFGSVFLNKKYMNSLKLSGVKIVVNDPVYFGVFNTRLNFRNHRKVIVIDGNTGFLGGINLGDEYFNKKKDKFGYWRDTHLMLKGPSVQSITQLFFRDWYYNTDKLIDDKKYYPIVKPQGSGLVQIIPSGPDFRHPPIRNVYVKMINNAKKNIKIMTPYIALDQELLTSLVIAANSGVKVQIIIPGIPDKKTIYAITKSFVEELLVEGIEVYTYTPGFCHAKVFIIDDKLASCGSYNLDNRSARINFEVTALLYNSAVKELVKDFHTDLSQSKALELKKWKRRGFINRVYEGLLNLFSPLV